MESSRSRCYGLYEPSGTNLSLVVILALWNCTVMSTAQVSPDRDHPCNQKLFTDITCAEKNRAYAECVVPGASELMAVKLLRNISEVECTYRVTYGFYGNYVWVNNGCSAQFRVCYIEGGMNITTTTGSSNIFNTSKNVEGQIHISGNRDIYIVMYILIVVVILLIICFSVAIGCFMRKRRNRKKEPGIAGKSIRSI